eukprot:g9999.t1
MYQLGTRGFCIVRAQREQTSHTDSEKEHLHNFYPHVYVSIEHPDSELSSRTLKNCSEIEQQDKKITAF